MRAAVLGGGLQGCCIALALAERGVDVTLFDKNENILSRTAVANEGKIHLGYMYAGDATLATAKTMMLGALSFGAFLEKYMGRSAQSFAFSVPATYVVHRDSQIEVEASIAYLNAVHDLVKEAANAKRSNYFGIDLNANLRPWERSEIEASFNPTFALAAVSSPEVAVNPVMLAQSIGDCISAHPRIQICCNHTVTSVKEEDDRFFVQTEPKNKDHFDHIINALWDGRFKVDAGMGFAPSRPWLHRLKYGISFRLPKAAEPPPSATFILGPFGEVVTYDDRLIYLTWYPECLQAISAEISPPNWPIYPPEPLRTQIIEGTFRALSSIVPSLSALDVDQLPEVLVKGGPIVAWGNTDIYDPQSELHRRFEIGVTSVGGFHSVDPGKLTMAPYFAEVCVNRITNSPN